MLGNAPIDCSLDDETSFNEGVRIEITAYLSEVIKNSELKADIKIAEQILATNTDRNINVANTETFDASV